MSEDAILSGRLYSNQHAKATNMQDLEWTVSNMVQKPLRVAMISWDVKQETNAELLSATIPQSAIQSRQQSLVMQTMPHRSFTFQRSGWKIKFQLNGTRFHQGRLAAYFVPISKRRYNKRFIHINELFGYPHVIMDASSNAVHEIDLPFVAPQVYSDTFGNPDDMGIGTLFVVVLNRLACADAAANELTLTIWESAINPSFQVPCFTHTYRAEPQGLVELIQKVLRPIGQPIVDVAQWIVALSKPLLGDPNRDKPTVPLPPTTVHNRMIGPLSHGRGLDVSERLCLDPSVNSGHPPEFTGTTDDEMNVALLAAIPCIFRQIEWDAGQPVGTLLTRFVVNPLICQWKDELVDEKENRFDRYVHGFIDTTQRTYHTTMIGYNSVPFLFWRGGLKFTFQFVSTTFHSGRAMVAWFPRRTEEEPTLEQAFSQPNTILDLQERNEFDFAVPYNSAYPALLTGKFHDGSRQPLDDMDLGEIRVYVLNRLVRPNNIPTTISVNLIISALEDYQVMVVRETPLEFLNETGGHVFNWTLFDPCPVVPQGNLAKSEGMRETDTREETSNILQKGKQVTTFDNSWLTNESFMDLKDVMRRYSYIGTTQYKIKGTEVAAYVFPTNLHMAAKFWEHFEITKEVECSAIACYKLDAQVDNRMTRLPLVGWFARIFTFHRGSLRYKIVPRTVTFLPLTIYVVHRPDIQEDAAWHVLSDADFTMTTGFATAMMNTSVNGCVEIEVPYYSQFGALINQSNDQIYQDQGSVFVIVLGPDGAEVALDFFVAIGDDFKMSYVMGPPEVKTSRNKVRVLCEKPDDKGEDTVG